VCRENENEASLSAKSVENRLAQPRCPLTQIRCPRDAYQAGEFCSLFDWKCAENKLRIPEHLFDEFLSYAYHDNKLTIRISLEVDRLPEETSAMYLRRAPVMVDGKYRNIIAIDLV
jgi:hypothetical protein